MNLIRARCNKELAKSRLWGSVMNNTSIFSADRMTHLKIVAVSLICASVVAGMGVAARATDGTVGSRLEAS